MDEGSDQQQADQDGTDQSDGQEEGDHQYVDRSKIDFDPEDGLYTGTAVDGTSEIPGPHEQDDSDGTSDSEPDEGSQPEEKSQ